MPLFRHDANLWAIGARAEFDLQPGDRLDNIILTGTRLRGGTMVF